MGKAQKSSCQFCGRTRREFLWEMGGGFGSVALAGMLGGDFFARETVAADGATAFANPMAPRAPHFPAKAKAAIFLFMYGGPSRQPTAEYAQGTGRDHNSYGFTMWTAGGGIQGGSTVGATDELGSAAVEHPFHVKNLHATILTQLGLDPNRLSYFYGGLDQKLVGVEKAEPIRQII